jgi:hypothetical protein
MLKILVGPLLVMLSGVTAAYAAPCATAVGCVAAPEIDPSSAVSAITLLLGGLVVLRGHGRAKRQDTVT